MIKWATDDSLRQALLQLLRGSGVDMSAPPDGPLDVDYLAPVVDDPVIWVEAAVVHLGEITTTCARLMPEIEMLLRREGYTNHELTEAAVAISVDISDELRFYLSMFVAFADAIRGAVMRGPLPADLRDLVPSRDVVGPSTPAGVYPLAEWIGLSARMPEEQAVWTARAIAAVQADCREAIIAIDTFASQPEAPVGLIAKRFADVHSACLRLIDVLLDADVASYILLRRLPGG